jgi:hypothetical protein
MQKEENESIDSFELSMQKHKYKQTERDESQKERKNGFAKPSMSNILESDPF